jgi:glycosyltransferase EpsE
VSDFSQVCVSIVVNNFNNERFLNSCLESLVEQTHRNIEIVVVDAFSTDLSRRIIDEFAEKDQRIKKVYCESYEEFPAVTYNLGFLNCSGKYIAINDPDDISMPNRIEEQLRFLIENPSFGAVGCNCFEFNDDGDILVETTVEKNVRYAAPPVRNPCLMLRKEVLATHGLWRWQCEYAADFEWLYRFYLGGVKFFIIPEPLVKFRVSHGTNISNKNMYKQGVKLATFRTWFGVRLFGKAGYRWWWATIRTYAFLLIKYPIKVMIKKFL